MDEVESLRRTPLDELIGAVVANRFRVEAVLGVGSMGVVFRARALGGDERLVALKVVLPDPRHQRTVPRLLRGARLAAQVKHPHVVETLAHGRVGPEHEGYFVAMELVDGIPLGRLMGVDLEVGAVCTLMCQVLDALAHMHARGVLHRDIKPDNVLVARSDVGRLSCKISDFGIAADLMADTSHLTQPGVVIGTPMYMAPEQMEGKGLDTPAIDLYPVGVMLYEFLCGVLPFTGASMTSLLSKISRDAPPLVAREGMSVPPGLDEVVMRLLARIPGDRYLLAADARHALEPFCGPALMSTRHWEELSWGLRSWESSQLPAGWGKGRALLATGTGHGLDAKAAPPANAMPLIGRDDLLAEIDAVAAEAEEGDGRAVLLTGELGMGKSEVVNEVAARLSASGRFLLVRLTFPPAGHLSAGLRQALDGVLGTTGRSALHVKQVVKDLVRRHGEDDAQEVRDLVAFLRPAGNEASEQAAMFALVHRCLRRLSLARPVLLCADDIQRGGPDVVAFLEFLLFHVGFEPFPLLVVAAVGEDGRSDAFDAQLGRLCRFEGSTLHRMCLPPVDEEVLAAALVAHLGVARSRAHQIARRAAGNPLFAAYLARTTSASQSSTGERGASLDERVPRALHELLSLTLRKRLARAPDPQRLQGVLESMAVLGAVVDLSLVEAFLADEMPPAQLERDVDTCLDLGLLQWMNAGEAELVSFVPQVLREVLIDGLNPRRARRLHRRAIEVRQAWAGERVDAEAGALGDHCEAAGRHEEAVAWWLRGQGYELAGGNTLRGVEWGLRALHALAPTDARHGPCALALGRVLLDAGDLARAEVVLLPVVDGADADLAMRAGDALGDVYENQGARDKWTALIERLAAREAEAGPAGRRSLYLARALWHNNHGRPQDGERDGARALDGAAPGEQAQRAAQRLVFSKLMRGQLEEAEAMAQRSLAECGDRLDLRLRSLRALGITALFQWRLAEAASYQQEVLDVCRRSGLLARIPFALSELGDTLRAQGRPDEARARYEAAERAAQELGMSSHLEVIHMRQLTCDLLQGRTDEVLARIHSTAARSAAAGMGAGPRLCALLEAWAHACEGRLAEALDAHDRVGELQEIVMEPQLVQVLEGCAEALLQVLEQRRGESLVRALATVRQLLEGAVELSRHVPAPGYQSRSSALLARLSRLH